MNLDDRSKNGLPSYESVCEDIAKLGNELRSQLLTLIRNSVGNIDDQSDVQVYMKARSVLMDLPNSLKIDESSWPIVFLEAFVPDSVNWLAHLRLERVVQIQDFIANIEDNLNDVESSDNECECVESDSECNESIGNNVESNEHEDEGSQICESEECNQQIDDKHNMVSSCYDGVCK